MQNLRTKIKRRSKYTFSASAASGGQRSRDGGSERVDWEFVGFPSANSQFQNAEPTFELRGGNVIRTSVGARPSSDQPKRRSMLDPPIMFNLNEPNINNNDSAHAPPVPPRGHTRPPPRPSSYYQEPSHKRHRSNGNEDLSLSPPPAPPPHQNVFHFSGKVAPSPPPVPPHMHASGIPRPLPLSPPAPPPPPHRQKSSPTPKPLSPIYTRPTSNIHYRPADLNENTYTRPNGHTYQRVPSPPYEQPNLNTDDTDSPFYQRPTSLRSYNSSRKATPVKKREMKKQAEKHARHMSWSPAEEHQTIWENEVQNKHIREQQHVDMRPRQNKLPRAVVQSRHMSWSPTEDQAQNFVKKMEDQSDFLRQRNDLVSRSVRQTRHMSWSPVQDKVIEEDLSHAYEQMLKKKTKKKENDNCENKCHSDKKGKNKNFF